MKIIYDKRIIKKELHSAKKTIGLVPTMGALHYGHEELIKNAKKQCTTTVVSIFVNPLQFNDKNDYLTYPKTIDEDIELLKALGVDYLYMPTIETMNIKNNDIAIDFGYIEHIWEGKYRPNHFRGVGIVVTKLFNHILPDYAYFGLKDYQQYLLINKMTDRLDFPIKIIGVPTERDRNGIALSSRNKNFNSLEMNELAYLNRMLFTSKERITAEAFISEDRIKRILNDEKVKLEGKTSIKVEYFVCLNRHTLKELTEKETLDQGILFISAYLGQVRVIDNLFLNL